MGKWDQKKMSKDQIKVNGPFEIPPALRAPAARLALRLRSEETWIHLLYPVPYRSL